MDNNMNIPLVVGRVAFGHPVTPWLTCNMFPYGGGIAPPKQVEADEINREYKTERIIVDKRTHRIRFEDESENQVTVVIEPKQ